MIPTFNTVVAAVIGAGFAAGLLLLGVVGRGVTRTPARPPSRVQKLLRGLRSPALTRRWAGAVVVGVLTLVLTRWPVAAAGVTGLVLCGPWLFGGAKAEAAQIVRLEALVMWTESLRDTITARASLEQAIPATTETAPPAIRPALIRLSGLVRARVPLDRALLSLSVELHDASADKVIGALILNVRQRGTGLAAVLTSLASTGRAELDQRRRIMAGRASMRRSVQIVVIITVGFAVFLVIFSRVYVKPYASVGGQVTLAVVLALFAASFSWMRRLAGGEPATPFLAQDPATISDADLRVVAHLTGLGAEEAQHLTANRPARPGVR
jgi:hypothetical protein